MTIIWVQTDLSLIFHVLEYDDYAYMSQILKLCYSSTFYDAFMFCIKQSKTAVKFCNNILIDIKAVKKNLRPLPMRYHYLWLKEKIAILSLHVILIPNDALCIFFVACTVGQKRKRERKKNLLISIHISVEKWNLY